MAAGSLEEPRGYKLYLQTGVKVLLVVILVAFIGIGVAIGIASQFSPSPKAPPPFVGLIFLLVIGINVFYFLSIPHRITLASDGNVEFISLLRRRTVRVQEIRSIKPAGAHLGFLVVSTDRGKIRLLAQFDGFHDFLTRLEALHPGVELRGC